MVSRRAWVWADESMTAVVLEEVPERLQWAFCALPDGRLVMRPADWPHERSLALGTRLSAGLPRALPLEPAEPPPAPVKGVKGSPCVRPIRSPGWRRRALSDQASVKHFG